MPGPSVLLWPHPNKLSRNHYGLAKAARGIENGPPSHGKGLGGSHSRRRVRHSDTFFFRGMADVLSLCSNRAAAREIRDYGLEAMTSPKANPPHAPASSLHSSRACFHVSNCS